MAAAWGERFVLLQLMTESGTAKEEELLLQHTMPARKICIHSEGLSATTQTPPAATQPPSPGALRI